MLLEGVRTDFQDFETQIIGIPVAAAAAVVANNSGRGNLCCCHSLTSRRNKPQYGSLNEGLHAMWFHLREMSEVYVQDSFKLVPYLDKAPRVEFDMKNVDMEHCLGCKKCRWLFPGSEDCPGMHDRHGCVRAGEDQPGLCEGLRAHKQFEKAARNIGRTWSETTNFEQLLFRCESRLPENPTDHFHIEISDSGPDTMDVTYQVCRKKEGRVCSTTTGSSKSDMHMCDSAVTPGLHGQVLKGTWASESCKNKWHSFDGL